MKVPGTTGGRKSRAPLTPKAKAAPSPVAASPTPAAAPTPPRAHIAAQVVATGPYADVLNNLTHEQQVAQDIAGRRMHDEVAYTAWQQQQQAKLGVAATGADQSAARANLATQMATALAARGTQQTLDTQRATRERTMTDGPGVSRQQIAGDDTLTQSLLAATQARQNQGAVSSQQKAGFLAAATAASGQANQARIAGELSDTNRSIENNRRQVLSQREQDKAQSASDAADRELKLAEDAQRAQQAQDALSSRESIAAAGNATRQSEGAANRASARERAKLSAKGRASAKGKGGVSASETRQRGDSARKTQNAYSSLKGQAQSLKAGGTTYSEAKTALFALPGTKDLAANSVALNAALSAVYDKRSKGTPYGKAASDYKKRLADLRAGR